MKFPLSVVTVCALSVTSWFTAFAEDAPPTLPELPSTSIPTAPSPNFSPSVNQEPSNLPSSQPSTPRPAYQPNAEDLEKQRKDKNWLVEGMREREAEAKLRKEESANAQPSAIDQLLERNRKQLNATVPPTGDPRASRNGFAPALNSSAWEPLPEPTTTSTISNKPRTTDRGNSSDSNSRPTWKAYDEKTGVPNLFYNSRTGAFQSEPADAAPSIAIAQAQWQKNQVGQIDNPYQSAIAEQQVMNFEARMVAEARMQNKIPESMNRPLVSDPNSSLSAPAVASPFAGNTAVNSNLQQPIPGANSNFSAQPVQQANDASVARLRLIEEERQRQAELSQKPTILDITHPLNARGIDINPRF